MDYIQEIIYLPTVRCNLNCKHCGENQSIKLEEEISTIRIADRIIESKLTDTKVISISGGEPFVKADIKEFILKILKESTFKLGITTNGFFSERIENVLQSLSQEEKSRLEFSVSVDGLENTHNSIRRNLNSYLYLMKTLDILLENQIQVGINTVVQSDNQAELLELKNLFEQKSGRKWRHSFIPMSVDISEKKENIYTKEYISAIWPFLQNYREKLTTVMRGTVKVNNCNAGKNNVAIGPDGHVYVCTTGAFFKEHGDRFCIGNLNNSSLDEIWLGSKRPDVRSQYVNKCDGCSGPCEVVREITDNDMEFYLSNNEVKEMFEHETTFPFGSRVIMGSGWHGIEHNETGSFAWMNGRYATLLVRNNGKTFYLDYEVPPAIADGRITVLCNGLSVAETALNAGHNIIKVPASGEYQKVTLVINKSWKPCEVTISTDTRTLGGGHFGE